MKKIITGLTMGAAALVGVHAHAADEAVLTVTQKVLSAKLQVEAAQTAIEFCAANNIRAHVVIVDAQSNVRLLLVGDGAKANTIDGARRKALTAALMGIATSTLQQRLTENPKMMLPPDPVILPMAGGVPIRVGNELIGAIGVGGGPPEQDEKCAAAGLAAIQDRLK